jgi:alkylation response protein AidB-like acyl-CoA dehydrogenase
MMRFAFTDDQKLLADGLGAIASRHWTHDHLARFWAGDSSVEDALAEALIEGGVLGLSVGEELGGLGQSMLDLAPSLELAGQHALPDWLSRHWVASTLVVDQPEVAQKAASGDLLLGFTVDAQRVPHGLALNALISLTAERVELLQHCRFNACESVDLGRPLYTLRSAGERRLIAEGEDASVLYRQAINTALLADSLQLLGLAQAALDLAVDYVKERHQFGKPVGAQQAVKHLLANALISLEFARPMVQRAAYAMHHREAELEGRISAAWLLTSEAAKQIERATLQVHGAMGYSYEYPLHYLLKRSWALRHGDTGKVQHRQRAAAWIFERNADA